MSTHHPSGQNVVDSRGVAEWVRNKFWPLWWRILVNKSTDHAKPHLICFFTTISKIRKEIFVKICRQLKTLTGIWKCMRCTMQMSYFYVSDFPFKNFCKLAQHAETIKKMFGIRVVTHSLSIRVQTTLNHISICFLPQCQRQRKCFFSEPVLKKTLRDTMMRAAWYWLLSTMAN